MSKGVETQPSAVWSARLIEAFGGLMVLHWLVAAALGGVGSTGVDLIFTAVLLAATIWSGARLRGGRRFARGFAALLAAAALFFVAPVVGTIVLGGGSSPVGTGWDFVFFPVAAALLVALLWTLRLPGTPTGNGTDGSS